jgi:hypothetical protein
MASGGWHSPPTVTSETYGDSYLFPWGLLVMTDDCSWEDIVRGLKEMIDECDRVAGPDGDRFMRLMSRFVVWDDDEFRERDYVPG